MKRIFLAIGALLLLIGSSAALTSCDMESNNKYNKFETTSRIKSVETEYPYRIYEVTYKGHDYIIFRGDSRDRYTSGCNSGVVHNPDCRKCNNM